MAREVKGGLWIERTGDSMAIGFTKEAIGGSTIKSVEALPVGSVVQPGGPLLLITIGKKEVEYDSPVSGKIVEVRPGLMKAGGGIGADPDALWVLKVRGGAVVEDEEEDDDADGEDLFDDEDED